jgi:electron transport complex protein RnfC
MLMPLRDLFRPKGVKIPAHKTRSLRSRLMPVPLPAQLRIPVGDEHEVLVKAGDRLQANQLIATGRDDTARRLYSPAAAVVVTHEMAQALGEDEAAAGFLLLDVLPAEQQQYQHLPAIEDYRSQSPEQILARLDEAGVHSDCPEQIAAAAIVRRGLQAKADTLIINAVESEPWVCADEAMIREQAQLLLDGAAMLQFASAARRCVIALQAGKSESIAALRALLKDSDIELVLAPQRYPAGDPGQLLKRLCGREIPAGANTEAAGAMILGANAARATARAVSEGLADSDHIVTLAGPCLQTPKNFVVPDGCSARHLLQLCGLDEQRLHRVWLGNPLKARLAANLDAPVPRHCKALIAADADLFPPRAEASACIRCGRCADVCPVNLQPQLLEVAAARQDSVQLQQLGLDACIDCAACNLVCPSNRPLLESFRAARTELQLNREQQQLSSHWQQRFQFHQYRIKKNKQAAVEARKNKVADSAPKTESFSRDKARQDIADAVARVQARRAGKQDNQS